jgi:hypothetical protein
MTDDPLPRLRVWLVKCQRHAQAPSTSEIAAITLLAIAELERMRGVVERLQGEDQKLEQVVTRRRGRGDDTSSHHGRGFGQHQTPRGVCDSFESISWTARCTIFSVVR